MVAENDPIVLKLKPALWRIVIASELFNPKQIRNITVKGSSSLMGAIDSAIHTKAFEDFRQEFPNCAVAKAELLGQIDNA